MARHESWLRERVFAMLRDADATEDVLQEVWLRAWRYVSGGESLRAPKAWLSRVASSVVGDQRRREASRAHRARSAVMDSGDRDQRLERDIRMEALGTQQVVDAAFNALVRLPERERSCAIMHFVAGLLPREIARRTKTTPRYVSTALLAVESQPAQPLRPQTLDQIRTFAGRYLSGASIPDPGGITSQSAVTRVKQNAAARLAGVLALPRP